MPQPQLKPIEDRDAYAAMVLTAFDDMENQKCKFCGGTKQYMDSEGMPRMCEECYSPTMAEMAEALRKAVAWGEAASTHILYRENINWRYLDEAKETLARHFRHSDSK